ncbi:UDP-N-acetylglucosamine 1-carboxyvinyltransferase [bacterium]|nr:UDP-N-acetylglucosamine 1-carboxyvinyltransferase [bacterium]
MDKIVIVGGNRLKGSVQISGSKNAVLPIMAGTLLADGRYHIQNVPMLRDVKTMSRLLQSMGTDVALYEHVLQIETKNCSIFEAPYDLVKTMRASIYVLGPLIGRFGYGKVSLPGGCAWGPRPVNFHIEGLQKLGAHIEIEGGYIVAKAKRLKGARIMLPQPSVGATGNLLLAAVLSKGSTLIENAAQEPEIASLSDFLNKMGAHIGGIGTSSLEIEGVDTLNPTDMSVIPDRIEAGTFLIAAHLTGGDVKVEEINARHLTALLKHLRKSGASIEVVNHAVRIQSDGQIKPVNVTTDVYPGFPTDMQAQWMVLMSLAKGSSVITEKIFFDRFTHVSELQRLGADITLDHNKAVVWGVDHLCGAPVMSTDLRASASLILAGLVAAGRTDISRVYHIDRGYEHIEEKLKPLGAEIWRDQEPLII